jgi:hypothetical protein
LRGYFTAAIERKGIQHQLHPVLVPRQRALQWFLKSLTVRSGIIAKFLNHNGGIRRTANVMVAHGTLQL